MELLQIEKELSGPRKAEALARYDQVLTALASRVREALARGLAPAEFERCRDLVDAVTVARKLLRLQTRPPDGAGLSKKEEFRSIG